MHTSENQKLPLASTPSEDNVDADPNSDQEADIKKDQEGPDAAPLSEVATRINLLGKLIIPPSVP